MKKNHIGVAQRIQEALRLCGEDFALQETRVYLRRALNSVSVVVDKRQRRQTAAEQFAEKAKQNHDRWWQQIVENTKKMAQANLEEDSTASESL